MVTLQRKETRAILKIIEEAFDPCCRIDPRLSMPGVLDIDMQFSQLNSQPDEHRSEDGPGGSGESRFRPHTGRWTYDSSTVSSSERGHALHSEALERQSEMWMSEARDHLVHVENTAAEEISKKNLHLNEQAAHAMSEHKSAQIHVQSQDQRIKELNAELHQAQSTAGLMNTSFQKTSSDLSAARSQFSQRITYKNQIDALNQQIMDMQKSADFIERFWEGDWKTASGTEGPDTSFEASTSGRNSWTTFELSAWNWPSTTLNHLAQWLRVVMMIGRKNHHPKQITKTLRQNHAEPFHPPGLLGGGLPDDDHDDDGRGTKGKKDKKKKKSSRGRSRRRRRPWSSLITFFVFIFFHAYIGFWVVVRPES